VSGDLVDTEHERRNTPPSAASELVGGCVLGARCGICARWQDTRWTGEQKQVSTS
jgi:hypothetical protein